MAAGVFVCVMVYVGVFVFVCVQERHHAGAMGSPRQ